MKTANSLFSYALLMMLSLAFAGCANQMEPAQQAIASIESTVSAASADAAKYVPDQLSAVQSQLADLKTKFNNKDYKAVVAGAPAVLSAAQGLASAASAKKDEVMAALSGEWSALSASLPGLLAAVQSRVDVLGKSKRPPAGVDLTAARAALTEANDAWANAQSASSSGNIEDAVNLARRVKDRATAAAAALKLTLPGA